MHKISILSKVNKIDSFGQKICWRHSPSDEYFFLIFILYYKDIVFV